jgi:hypothetical protein
MIRPILSRAFSPRLKGYYDYYFRPELRSGFGGPFNGQQLRRQLFHEILKACSFESIIETGTYRGTTTEFMAVSTRLPTYTVELAPRFAAYSKARLRSLKNVVVLSCDSRAALHQLSNKISSPFCYLDAHWNNDLPLNGELLLIKEHWPNAVIMIDDFRVEGDDGYAFDDYGEGKRLCMDYFDPKIRQESDVFFPSEHSSQETGAKRGCAVLAPRDSMQSEKLSCLKVLRRFDDAMGQTPFQECSGT